MEHINDLQLANNGHADETKDNGNNDSEFLNNSEDHEVSNNNENYDESDTSEDDDVEFKHNNYCEEDDDSSNYSDFDSDDDDQYFSDDSDREFNEQNFISILEGAGFDLEKEYFYGWFFAPAPVKEQFADNAFISPFFSDACHNKGHLKFQNRILE